ncbi:MAG TPA: hypothetical protein VN875_03735 [Candidatus Binatus sp.]|nr:hypothetical protein [Candidatus Binatus sp.]
MALTFSLVDSCEDGKRVHVSDTLVASGNYTPAGDTLDLLEVPVIASNQTPVQGTAWMDGPADTITFFYPWEPVCYSRLSRRYSVSAAAPGVSKERPKPGNSSRRRKTPKVQSGFLGLGIPPFQA